MKSLSKLMLLAVITLMTTVSLAHNHPTFIPNQGQWDGPFQYKSEFQGLTVFAEMNGFTYVMSEPIEHRQEGDNHHVLPDVINKHAFRLKFVGANEVAYNGRLQKSGYHNYILGNDRSKWKGHVPIYQEIYAENLYSGIDIKAYGESGSFKYDFIVQPGANANQILFQYAGVDELRFDNERILIKTSVDDLYESIPISYQFIGGQKVEVACQYVYGEDGFSFTFPEGYNVNYELVIDPVLVAATLSGTGSGGSNFGHGATFDLAGNIYTHAISFDSQYPTDEGSFQEFYGGGGTDAAISKLTPDGSDLIYATFLGGQAGEYPHSTIVNGNEEIYVFGITESNDYPTALSAFQPEYGGQWDAFVTGLSADGSELVGSTYLGGSSWDGRNNLGGGYDTYRGEINVNLLGEIFIASCSGSDDYPTTEGVAQPEKKNGQDGVVTKLSGDLSEIVWSTFLGSDVDDMAYGLRVGEDQTVFVCGAVGGSSSGGNGDGFPITAGAYQETFGGGTNDGFVAVFSPDGSTITRSTFMGLEGADKCLFMDLDSDDNIWVYMESNSDWTPSEGVIGTGESGISVHKLSGDLTNLELSSYLSDQANANGTPVAFMVDLCDGIYVSAYSVGSNFIVSEDALFDNGGFYLGVFEPDMSEIIYGTYYTENHVDGGTSRFDKQGIVYQGVCSGGGFNTTDDAWAPNQSTGWDVGVFKIDFEVESVNAVAGAAGQLSGCAPHTVSFDNYSTGDDFTWLFGDGNMSNDFEPEHLYDEPGDYLVSLIVYDPESCNVRDTAYIPITVYPEVDFIADFTYELDCESGLINIIDMSEGPADIEYEWDMGDGTILTDVNPSYAYDEPGEYTVTLNLRSDACNQEMIAEQNVIYLPDIEAEFTAAVLDFCDSYTIGVYDATLGGISYDWNMGDGNVVDTQGSFEYQYDQPGTYTVTLIASNPATCNLADTMSIEIDIMATPVLVPQITIAQTGFCDDLEYEASVSVEGPVSTIEWTVDGEIVGNEMNVSGNVDETGLSTINVVVTDAFCEHAFTDIEQFQFHEYLGFQLDPFVNKCYYEESLVLDATATVSDVTYSWTPGGETVPQITVFEGGEYEVTVGYSECIEVQDTDVNGVLELPLAFQEEICAGYPNTIVFPNDLELIDEVNWEDGQTGFTIEVTDVGYHPFVAIDIFGCDQIDSLFTYPREDDPQVEIPNVFTPNGDGFNDVFQIESEQLVYFEMEIYDRWGRMVYRTDDLDGTWDGKLDLNDKEGGDETYMYIIRFRDYCAPNPYVETGYVKVLR